MTSFVIWLIVGGLIGWLASVVTKDATGQRVLFNVIVGATGAFLGSVVMGNGIAASPDYSLASFMATCAGSALSAGIVSLFRKGALP